MAEDEDERSVVEEEVSKSIQVGRGTGQELGASVEHDAPGKHDGRVAVDQVTNPPRAADEVEREAHDRVEKTVDGGYDPQLLQPRAHETVAEAVHHYPPLCQPKPKNKEPYQSIFASCNHHHFKTALAFLLF